MSAHVPVGTIDYELWFKTQQYGPGAYPAIETLTFLSRQDAEIYNSKIRFQEETMRVHETIAPTTATAYDITDLSRHVFGYWEMMLGIAKADPVWVASYGGINTPRSFNSSWSRAKQHIRELIIKNQRAADQAAADAANEDNEVGEVEEVDDEGGEDSDEESVVSVIIVDCNNDGEESNDEGMDDDEEMGDDDEGKDSDEEMGDDDEGEDGDEEMDDSVIVVEYNDEEEEGYAGEMYEGDEEDEDEEDSDEEIVGF
ncbi:hypothetical protein EAE96_000251 [Botrytis aclada]|nr:hypothetical protein EAE96_000251 [Botrytis aclada]